MRQIPGRASTPDVITLRILCLLGLAAGLLHGESPDALGFGEKLYEARQAGKPLPQFSLTFPNGNLRDAYNAQGAYVAALLENSEKLAGFKGGVVSEGGQNAFGIDFPLCAVLFESGFLLASEKGIQISADTIPDVGIETEIGFILEKEVTEPLKSVEEVKAVVRSVVPVIELPAGKREVEGKTTAADLVAVNVMSQLYIVGAERDPGLVDLDSMAVKLWKGEELVNDTTGDNARRGQWWNLLFQINHALAEGYEVKPGQLIITGALGKIYKEVPGDFRAEWSGLGSIAFRIVE